jgi:tetratricopeptide (TPR) repeat protein
MPQRICLADSSGVRSLSAEGTSPPARVVPSLLRHVTQRVDLGGQAAPHTGTDRAGGVERVLLQPFESPYIWGGQDVVLQLRPGLLGLSWLESIEHDEGKYYAGVLAKVPGARLAHQRQVYFYLHRRRIHDAARAARAYLERYPDDYAFAKLAATSLGAYGHYEAMAMVLEPFAARRANYEAVALGGFALGKIGRKAEAIRLLETAIAMEPDNWWGYYFAGYVYGAVQRYADAVTAFERSLARRPGSPEVQAELARMRQLKAAHEAAAARRAAAAAGDRAVKR